MTKTEIIIASLVIVAVGFSIYGLVFNRDLYCKIAMWDKLSNVPAICLEKALNNLNYGK